MGAEEPNVKISVVTASYNYADYIREAIESVIGQTYDNWELIVVDDGSKDNSLDVIKEYCKKDSRIKLFTHPNNQNLGLKDTLLLGIKKAKGEWVAFLESDDIFKENALEEKIKIAEKNPNFKIIFSDVEMFGDEESIEVIKNHVKDGSDILSYKSTFKEKDIEVFIEQNFVLTFSCVMAKREKLLQCNFNTPVKHYLDWFLWAQFVAGDFYYINQKLTKWRMHKKSYINFIQATDTEITEFLYNIKFFVYSNEKHSLTNLIKYYLERFQFFRKKIIRVHFKAGEVVFLNKKYSFKKQESEIAKINPDKNRVAVFAHWDKDCLIEDYVVYYLKGLKNVAQKIIFVSDCDVKKEELEKLNGVADIIIAQRHNEYDFGSYKRGFLYAKENGLLENCDELIFANDSCYAPLFPFENMFEAMAQKQVDFWGNTLNHGHVKHMQSYFLVFRPKVFNSKTFNNFAENIKKENSKDDVIQNYELKLTKFLEEEGFQYASYCKAHPEELGGLHIILWRNLIKEDKSPFLKVSVPKFENTKVARALGWKRILTKYTDYDINLIRKDLKRKRKILDIFKEISSTLKHIRRKIIRVHFGKKKIYLFEKLYDFKKTDSKFSENDLISVIIPCYNQGEFINDSINSALAQTYQNIEIIVVNDGSNDEFTEKKLAQYKNPKIKILTTQNQGVSVARNTGISEASGKYILPLDADDKIYSTYIEKAVKAIKKNPDLGIVYCEAEFFGEKTGKWCLPPYSLKYILNGNCIFCTALFKKSDWEKAGGYKKEMNEGWEDYDFWLSLIEAGKKVYQIPEILFSYRQHDASATNSPDWEEKQKKLFKKIVSLHPNMYQKNKNKLSGYNKWLFYGVCQNRGFFYKEKTQTHRIYHFGKFKLKIRRSKKSKYVAEELHA